jgi:arylsulfatase A
MGHPVVHLRGGVAVLVAAVLAAATPAAAHPWHRHRAVEKRSAADEPAADAPASVPFRLAAAKKPVAAAPVDIEDAFAPFVKRGDIQTRRDDRWFFVESNGVPDHPLMVGIRNWQQQVPLPQKYVGGNAWQIPLHPVPAAKPQTTKDRFLRGAIAVAVNGIPIFNPLNNRGEDALAIGELDDYGGHCGRADDYHYHVAPVHLEKVVGKGKPIAYALDGYPIYGTSEPDGSPVKDLDWMGGHEDAAGSYHYHATRAYPYLNGGFRGEVTEREGQVDPQPRAEPRRPALPPLRGATIVGFEASGAATRTLTYEIAGRQGSVEYTVKDDGAATFTFTDPQGRSTTETYEPRQRGPGGRRPGGTEGGPPRRPPPAEGRPPPPPRDGRPPRSAAAAEAPRPPNVVFILMDDMGWRDVGFMGNTFVETPHIDRLAQQGLVFTQAYASAPNCAPTRACLMSGQTTPRHGIYTVVDPRQPPGSPWHKLQAAESRSELATEIVTLPEALKARGYATAFLGMWNLGRGRTGPVTPGGQGFDRVVFPENLGFAKDAYFDADGKQLSDRLTDEALAFIERQHGGPFFVYLADHAIHAPYDPEPELRAKYDRKAAAAGDRRNDPAQAATIEAVDRNVGRIVERLTTLGLAGDTLLIFTSDNGGTSQHTPPLKGGKGELFEGGIRVPLVVAGAGVATAGSTCDEPVTSVDFYPTLLELAGAKPPAGQTLDGTSLVSLLRGAKTLPRARLFWHFPCYVGRATPSSAIREGRWKLIEFFEDGGRLELYDLAADPAEHHDLSRALPDRTAGLAEALHEWQRQTAAVIPATANPAYDPQADRPRGGARGDGGGGRGRGGRGPSSN